MKLSERFARAADDEDAVLGARGCADAAKVAAALSERFGAGAGDLRGEAARVVAPSSAHVFAILAGVVAGVV